MVKANLNSITLGFFFTELLMRFLEPQEGSFHEKFRNTENPS